MAILCPTVTARCKPFFCKGKTIIKYLSLQSLLILPSIHFGCFLLKFLAKKTPVILSAVKTALQKSHEQLLSIVIEANPDVLKNSEV